MLLLITAAFAVDPIVDASNGASLGEVTLTMSGSYLALEPISNVLDTLTLLTVGQHVAIMLWAIVIFALVRVARSKRNGSTFKREGLATLGFVIGLFVVYAAVAMLPRPMAAITTSDNAILVADFHSHTKYSHDGRSGWTPADVRDWYAGAGFNVAYVTDHKTVDGAERGISSNRGQAGEGTMLLQGIEAFYRGEHVNLLGAGRRFAGLLDPTLANIDSEAVALASFIPSTAPSLIETMPGNLDRVKGMAASRTTPGGITAIEIVDGSPRGLSQTRKDRARIVALADSFNLALVSGSDNHGWGRAAAGWTLLRIPGWRGMTTDSIAPRIEEIIHLGRRQGTRVVERRVAGATNPLTVAVAPLLAGWRMFTTLSSDERVAWGIWIWAITAVAFGLRRWRMRPSVAA